MASIRVLYDKLDFGFTMLEEILNHSVFTDEKRLGEVIQETRSRAKMKLENAGHNTAVSRATSYFSATAYYNELTGGTAYYHFLEQLEKDYAEKRRARLSRDCRRVSKKLFTRVNMLVNYTADDKGLREAPETLKASGRQAAAGSGEKACLQPSGQENLNEGLKTSAQVDYGPLRQLPQCRTRVYGCFEDSSGDLKL